MRVVDLGSGNYEEHRVHLTADEAPWILAAVRHLAWLVARLS